MKGKLTNFYKLCDCKTPNKKIHFKMSTVLISYLNVPKNLLKITIHPFSKLNKNSSCEGDKGDNGTKI